MGKSIKLISFDAFDTLIHIRKSTQWLQKVVSCCELPPDFSPMELHQRLLCSDTPALETMKQLGMVLDDDLAAATLRLLAQEQNTIEQVIFAKEILEEAASNYKTAVISNLSQDFGAPAQKALNHEFDHVLFSYELGYAKPDTRIFNKLITDSGLQPHEILHVGNSYTSDYLGATSVGMQALHLGLRGKQKTPHRINSIGELINYL